CARDPNYDYDYYYAMDYW
nr:immunoglobulin heavy chain junction region [Mus musculus]